MRTLVILGATGSIGCNTLDVVAMHPEHYQVLGLTGATQVAKLFAQIQQFKPRYAVMTDVLAADKLRQLVKDANLPTEV